MLKVIGSNMTRFISQVSGGELSIDAKRHIWFTGRADIFTFLLLLLHYWDLCYDILRLNFSLKYYSNSTLTGYVFESVSFGIVMRSRHWKSQISSTTLNVHLWKSCDHSSMKRFPPHLWQERYNISFWMTSYMPQSQQKRVLKDWWEAEIPLDYGQTYESKHNWLAWFLTDLRLWNRILGLVDKLRRGKEFLKRFQKLAYAWFEKGRIKVTESYWAHMKTKGTHASSPWPHPQTPSSSGRVCCDHIW